MKNDSDGHYDRDIELSQFKDISNCEKSEMILQEEQGRAGHIYIRIKNVQTNKQYFLPSTLFDLMDIISMKNTNTNTVYLFSIIYWTLNYY